MTGGFKEAYRSTRPMIERTIAWLVYGSSRRLRYRGSEKNRIWLTVRVAAINLKRLVNLGLAHDGTSWVMSSA